MDVFYKSSLSFAGRWFDGRSAMSRTVQAGFDGDRFVFATADEVVSIPLAEVHVAEPLAHTPRLFDLPARGVVQIDESAALAAALSGAGRGDSPVVRAQRAWPAALVALVLLVALAAFLYLEGLPRAADWAARHVSPALEERMGDQALAVLDKRMLLPSKLSAARQAALIERFIAFEDRAALPRARRIEFRSVQSGPGVNAFALPGGTIVFLDGMVALAGNDDEILLAVLAHESGHQSGHHMTRALFRALGGGALAGLLWGDYSSVASHSAILFGQLRYSRADEAVADDFAIAGLRRAGISPGALARLFFREDSESKKNRAYVPEWLSTHPGDRDRAEHALEAAEAYRDAAASAASAAATSVVPH